MPRVYGYPGVKTMVLPDEGTITQTQVQESRPYLCVAHDTELNTVQPLRLAATFIAAPVVLYTAKALPDDRPVLKAATALTAMGIAAWSLWIWVKADTAMHNYEP